MSESYEEKIARLFKELEEQLELEWIQLHMDALDAGPPASNVHIDLNPALPSDDSKKEKPTE